MKFNILVWALIIVCLPVLISTVNAQDTFGSYGTALPWDSPGDYMFDENASLFWNTHFRPGRGLLGANLGEYMQFDSQDDANNTETHGGEVFDFWTGLFVGGVVYEGFLLKIEGGTQMHQVKPPGKDHYHRYEWGMTFAGEIQTGIAFTKEFTAVIRGFFRVWSCRSESHPTVNEANSVIESEGFLLRTELYFYFEPINVENKFSFNFFAGAGYHYYKAKEEDLKTEYHPRGINDVDLIAGTNFIFAGQFGIEAKVYYFGIFSVALTFSYLG